MSSVLNDTIGSAKNAVEFAKEGTEHAVSRARSTFVDGICAVSGLIGAVRDFNVDRGLGYFGLERRSRLRELSVFGIGLAVGAGAALLLAPMTGADSRRTIMSWFNRFSRQAKDTLDRAETEVKSEMKEVGDKAEVLADKAKDTFKKVERKVENKLAYGAETLKDKVEATADAVKDKIDTAADALKTDTVKTDTVKTHTMKTDTTTDNPVRDTPSYIYPTGVRPATPNPNPNPPQAGPVNPGNRHRMS